MTFQEQLNLYIEELSCSGRELAKNSGISETILSRYRKGERLPVQTVISEKACSRNCPDCRAKRKENRSGKGFGGSFGSLEAGRKNRDFLLPKV